MSSLVCRGARCFNAHVDSLAKLGNWMKPHQLGTKAVHCDEMDELTNAVISPIVTSTTFKTRRVQSPHKMKVGSRTFEYGRSDNPTRHLMEQGIAQLEHGEYGIALSSGSACTALIGEMMADKEQPIVCMSDVYGGTYRYFTKLFKKVQFMDLTKPIEGMHKDTPLVWIETPTNPTCILY